MKTCPNCRSEVEENFDLCWNCQYSFVDNKVLNESDFKLVCPKCHAEIKASDTYCPNCQSYLGENNFDNEISPEGPLEINCLRCQTPMFLQGNFQFHEGTRLGTLGDLFELFTNRESFDVYVCRKCGKVEFFLPGY